MRKTIRLACRCCDRQDFDGITAAELRKAIKDGWQDVSREQSYRESCKTYDDTSKAPPGFSPLDWFTHLGTCPDCAKAQGMAR